MIRPLNSFLLRTWRMKFPPIKPAPPVTMIVLKLRISTPVRFGNWQDMFLSRWKSSTGRGKSQTCRRNAIRTVRRQCLGAYDPPSDVYKETDQSCDTGAVIREWPRLILMLVVRDPAAFTLDMMPELVLGPHGGGHPCSEGSGVFILAVADAVDEKAGLLPVCIRFDDSACFEVSAKIFKIHGPPSLEHLFVEQYSQDKYRAGWENNKVWRAKTLTPSSRDESSFYPSRPSLIYTSEMDTISGIRGTRRAMSGVRALASSFRFVFYRVLAALARRLPVRAHEDGRQVLLVLRPDAIGDYLLFRPWLRWLREASPWAGWRIVLAGNQVWRDLAIEFDADCFDEALWIERRRLMRRPVFFFRVARRLRRFRADLLLYPVVSREVSGDLLVRASGARQAIAAECDGINLDRRMARLADRWYTRLLPVVSRGFEFHRTRSFSALSLAVSGRIFPGIPVSLLQRGMRASPERYVMLFPEPVIRDVAGRRNPGAGWRGAGRSGIACWSVEAGTSAHSASKLPRAQDPRFWMLDWLAGVGCCSAGVSCLCHDSMALHLAVACRVPVVCIGNGNHYGRFVPYPESLHTRPLVLLVPSVVLAQPDPESVFAHGSAVDISGVDFEVVARSIRALVGSAR